MAQFNRYQFIPSAKLFTRYISRPFLFKIYGCDLVINLLDIIGSISGLCPARRDTADYVEIAEPMLEPMAPTYSFHP
jgi:hypothetical protein